MTAILLQDRRWVVGAVAAALVVGASVALSPWTPIALIAFGALVAAGVRRPGILVPAVFAGILTSNAGIVEPVSFGVNITLGKLSMALALGVWALHAWLYERPLLVATRFTAPMAAILIVMTSSLAWAGQIRKDFGVTEIVGFALLFVMLHWVRTVLDEQMLPFTLRTIAWILTAIMAWTLWTTGDMTWWEEYERAEGIYDNANYWCAILLLTTPMIIALLVEDEHWTSPFLLAAIAGLLPLNIVASLSRSGFVAFLGVLPFLAWLLRRRLPWVALGAVIVVALAPSFADPQRIARRYESLVDPSLQEVDGSLNDRAVAARAAIDLFFDDPLLGVGVGMYKPAAIEATSGAINVEEPHNTYAWIAAEQGLLGLAVHAWFFFEIARLTWSNVRRAPPGPLARLSVGFAGSMLAVALMAFTAGFMTFPIFYLVLGVGLVLAEAIDRAQPVRSAPPA